MDIRVKSVEIRVLSANARQKAASQLQHPRRTSTPKPNLSLQASRPRPAIDESHRLEVGAGPKGMRLKRGQARVYRLAICVDSRRFAVLVVHAASSVTTSATSIRGYQAAPGEEHPR